MGVSLDDYLAMLCMTWDAHHGTKFRPFVGLPEAAGLPAPGSHLDVYGDWQLRDAA